MKIPLPVEAEILVKDYWIFHHRGDDLYKAKRMLKNKGHLFEISQANEALVALTVPSEGYDINYKVRFKLNTTTHGYDARCSCPQFSRFKACKHLAAACLWLKDAYGSSKDTSLKSAQTQLNKKDIPDSTKIMEGNPSEKSLPVLGESKIKTLIALSRAQEPSSHNDVNEAQYRYVPVFAVNPIDQLNFAYFECHLLRIELGVSAKKAWRAIPLRMENWNFSIADIPKELHASMHFFAQYQSNEFLKFEARNFPGNENMEEWRENFLSHARIWWNYAVRLREVYIFEDLKRMVKVQPLRYEPCEKLVTLDMLYNRLEHYAELLLDIKAGSQKLRINGLRKFGSNFFADATTLYFHDSLVTKRILEQFSEGNNMVMPENFALIESQLLPRLEKIINVTRNDLSLERVVGNPLPVVILSEVVGGFLFVDLVFRYADSLLGDHDGQEYIIIKNEIGNSIIMERNYEKEWEMRDFVISQHPNFKDQTQRYRLHLTIKAAKANLWLHYFIDTLSREGYEIQGQESLRSLKISKAKFKFQVTSGSAMDWFELETFTAFDSEQIELKRVVEAIQSGEQFVLLSDGSHGIIPNDWIHQFGLMMKMGQVKSNRIKIAQSQLMLLQSDDESIIDENFRLDLRKRQSALLNIENQKWAPPGKKLKATLRPYQQAGFNWLQQMHYAGFGACLADDMGLGKTLQTIAFIDYLLNKQKQGNILVVCPTSLLFNWESEFEKFAPHIGVVLHHGAERGELHFNSKKRVCITSYGTLRNDLAMFSEQNWLYVILDESQAIKNPDTLLSKAVASLPATNRLILSGTPVQNNTLDLWSQFNFINPGLLGNQNFFKNTFAKSIDKHRDTTVTAELNMLIKPFMLRRTKEQVAKDLPAKTESILWCEMNADQRKIYDEVKTYYRLAISKSISQEGIEKSSFKILEGLLKLRQICDSPKLLKSKAYNKASSAKIDELVRELEENTGEHKVLVFSQFTEMLELVKAELEKKEIAFNYLDGSTTPTKRKAQVDQFQNDPETRVFLISLKAGGVGLNLTSADYVYLIDPWWNPAAEQQAIDRTHRIGQTKSVFAYKMICKDSIEEKVLQLQSRKKEVAGDLIKEDMSMFKKMTKEDIIGLFS